jgi:glyoxylase-like metal-dependent hydrolase (beta-lactamase superfamily II)
MKSVGVGLLAVIALAACQPDSSRFAESVDAPQSDSDASGRFCEELPRPQWARLNRHPASNDWFEVYEVASNTFAIYEPFQWQEIISYLIVGSDSALLFDSGNGIGDIKSVVDTLTDLPVIVINSHSHPDHVGGNYQFEDIRSVSTGFSIERANGSRPGQLLSEVSPEALCKPLPAGVIREQHRSRPYTIQKTLADGDTIDLGGRVVEVIRIPGHTDDSIALLEADAGFLWTGDSFYEGPIWLFGAETDLTAYALSLERLARLAPELTLVFPAHNSSQSDPKLLVQLETDFRDVMRGDVQPVSVEDGQARYQFEAYSFLLGENPGDGGQ